MKWLSLLFMPVLSVNALTIVLDESHAATFGAVVQSMPLDEPCRLLLVDAHCDANEPTKAGELRSGIRRVTSREQRAARVRDFRRSGRIQAYNWLVPLMPLPVERVYWLSPNAADALEYLPPQLAGRWSGVKGWEELPRDAARPWVASVDLDAFAHEAVPGAALRRTWFRILSLPNLQLITVCASTPWQKSVRHAQILFDEAVSLAMRTHPADVVVGSDVKDAPDTSRRSAELGGRGAQCSGSGSRTCSHDTHCGRRQFVRSSEREFRSYLGSVRTACYLRQSFHLADGREKLFRRRCAVRPSLARKLRKTEHDGMLDARYVPLGTSWWQARSGKACSAVSPVVRREGEGFHAALSGLMGTPYMFGAGLTSEGRTPVAASSWGNDCANFLASAACECGVRIPCVSPGQLRDYLERYDGGAFTDLVYHAGNHVAALWQDRPPVGQFGPEDLLVHHLGGLPETLTRAEFERRFPRPKHDTLVWKRQPMLLAAVGNPSFSPGGVKAVLPEADVILAHLEGAVDAGRPAPSPRLAEPGQVKKVLHGVDCVSLAAYSRDAEDLPGLADMCRELDEAGIRYVGVGRDPVVIEKKGVRLALWGVLDTVPDNMEEWREKVDQLIVLVYWDG